jgi:hypothetical protein
MPADLKALRSGLVHRFRDWPNARVPRHAAGVYTVWRSRRLVYVGMAGRGETAKSMAQHKAKKARPKGLYGRLASHAKGFRSGDQFCVYVADRYVLPRLTRRQIASIATGEHKREFDALVRTYIHGRLRYRYVLKKDGRSAAALERRIRAGDLGQVPELNGAD